MDAEKFFDNANNSPTIKTKEKSSGGSFGIGKSATFACSDLRTVFYSSFQELDINRR